MNQIAQTLWYSAPANTWVEALPVGNGRLGAMVFGGIAEERLQLNEDTLWSGGPRPGDNPAARDVLPAVREAIFAGQYAVGRPPGQADAGHLHPVLPAAGRSVAGVRRHRRRGCRPVTAASLSLDDAIATTQLRP